MKCYFMQLEGEAGHFTHGENYLLTILSFVPGVEGDEATSPSFAAENEATRCFQLVARSAYCTYVNAEGMQTATLYPRQTKYLFADI